MKNKIIAVASILFLASCAASVQTTMAPGQSDVDRVQTKYPGYTVAQLNEGKSLYEQKCASCHALKSPSSEAEAEWNHIVPDMVKKANRKGAGIDAPQQDLILKYVITMSSATVK